MAPSLDLRVFASAPKHALRQLGPHLAAATTASRLRQTSKAPPHRGAIRAGLRSKLPPEREHAAVANRAGKAADAREGKLTRINNNRRRPFDLHDGSKALVRIYPSLILRQQDEESQQREYARFVTLDRRRTDQRNLHTPLEFPHPNSAASRRVEPQSGRLRRKFLVRRLPQGVTRFGGRLRG